jgi:hypothetical protein
VAAAYLKRAQESGVARQQSQQPLGWEPVKASYTKEELLAKGWSEQPDGKLSPPPKAKE